MLVPTMFDLWTEAVRSIEPMVKPAHRDLWLRPIECVGIDDGRIRLRAPNRYHKEWFEDNFLPPILRDLESRTQRSFVVDRAFTVAYCCGQTGGRRVIAPEIKDNFSSHRLWTGVGAAHV